MAKDRLTNKAVEDLNLIWNYTFDKWSELQADKYYSILIERFQDIANRPDIGREYQDILPGIRGLKVIRHIIFYRKIDRETVEIIRILHGRMDTGSRLKG